MADPLEFENGQQNKLSCIIVNNREVEVKPREPADTRKDETQLFRHFRRRRDDRFLRDVRDVRDVPRCDRRHVRRNPLKFTRSRSIHASTSAHRSHPFIRIIVCRGITASLRIVYDTAQYTSRSARLRAWHARARRVYPNTGTSLI